MRLKCGCEIRNILKGEREDYPEGTSFILDKICKEHKQQLKKELKEVKQDGI